MSSNEEEISRWGLGTQTLTPNHTTAGKQTPGNNKSYTGEGIKNRKPANGHASHPQHVS